MYKKRRTGVMSNKDILIERVLEAIHKNETRQQDPYPLDYHLMHKSIFNIQSTHFSLS